MRAGALRAAACCLAAAAPAAEADLLELVQEAARTGRAQSGPVAGMLGRLGQDALGSDLIARVEMIERLPGDCGRFAVRLRTADARSAHVADVALSLCRDGSAPPKQP